MAGKNDAEALCDGGDGRLQRLVCEGLDLSGAVVDQMMVVIVRCGDFEPCHAISLIETPHESQVVELIEDSIDRGGRPDTRGAEKVGDLLRAEDALTIASEGLEHRGSCGARAASGSAGHP